MSWKVSVPERLREIDGPAGRLEALLDEPDTRPRAAAVFAHPHPLYGGTMHSRPVYEASKALARIGVAVLRINFRGVGLSAGSFDGGPGEMDDYRAGLDFMAARHPSLPLWACGFSFGSWIAWSVALEDARVPLLVGVGLPVTRFDFTPVVASRQAKVLFHGELDDLIPVRDVRRFYGQLSEPKELIVIDGADHVFNGRTGELGDAVAGALADVDAGARLPEAKEWP